MKTKYKVIPLQLVLITLLISCKKQDTIDYPQAVKFPSLNWPNRTNNIDTIRLMMIGTYHWVRTAVSNRQGTQYSSPYTEHKTIKYIFWPNSTVDLYEGGKFKWSNKYVVDYEIPVTILPSAGTVISIIDKTTGSRIEYFYPFLSNDSASFYNPGSSDMNRYFARQ